VVERLDHPTVDWFHSLTKILFGLIAGEQRFVSVGINPAGGDITYASYRGSGIEGHRDRSRVQEPASRSSPA
jgi:hypothetical protein